MKSIMKFDKYDLVAVSPHPDDAEIGCGGTLAKLAHDGFKVAIVDLTNGEPTPFNDNPDIRIKESLDAANELGVERILLNFPNRTLMDSIDNRISLAKCFRLLKPDIIIGPAGMTPLASPDHHQAQLITDAAIFYSRLSKWEHLMENLPLWRINKYFYYYTGRELRSQNFDFQFVNNISETFEQKKSALLKYKSQFKAHSTYNPPIIDWIESMAVFFGSQSNCKYGEIFFSPSLISFDFFKPFLKSLSE